MILNRERLNRCYAYCIVPKYFRNQKVKSEIERTILTCFNYRPQSSAKDGRKNYRKAAKKMYYKGLIGGQQNRR